MGHIQIGETNMAILAGREDLSLWDEEELRRGQRKSRNGKFHGRPPTVVPKAIHDELVRRLQTKARARLDEDLYDAVAIMGEIIRDPDASNADKLTASKLIQDRVWGKAANRVQLTAEDPVWLVALAGGVVSLPVGEGNAELMQAEVIEADGWDEEDG